MAIFDQEYKPPEPDESDTAHAVVRSILGALPLLGDAAVEIFTGIITPSLTRRQQEWMNDVADALKKLESQTGIRPEQLRDNPAFIDAVLSATQAAVRTSQVGKREALRNAILNAALPQAPELAVQQMYIAMIDRFTEWHLRVLQVFSDPKRFLQGTNNADGAGSLLGVITTVYPELASRRELCDLIWSDLANAGFHRSSSLHTMMTPHGTLAKRTTELADDFLHFIESPI